MLDCDLFLTHVCPALSRLNARETSCFSNKKLCILHSVIFVVKRQEVCFIVLCVTSINYPDTGMSDAAQENLFHVIIFINESRHNVKFCPRLPPKN